MQKYFFPVSYLTASGKRKNSVMRWDTVTNSIQKIWPIIGKDFFEAMNFNLNENKALSVSQRTSIITLLFKGNDKEN